MNGFDGFKQILAQKIREISSIRSIRVPLTGVVNSYGHHKFRFEFEIRGLEKGQYKVLLRSEGTTIKELAVGL